ncbi:MAG: hypothetical protein ACO1Q7_00415 [Gemmatimonas sp.]
MKTRLKSGAMAAATIVSLVIEAGALPAQTARVVTVRDSALLITTLPACSAPCTDSARIEWRYGGQYVQRRAKLSVRVDTSRVARIREGSEYTDSAVLMFTPFPLSNPAKRVGLAIAPIATEPQNTAASDNPVPTTPAAAATASKPESEQPKAASQPKTVAQAPAYSGGPFVQPKAPVVLSVPYPKLSGKVRRVASGDNLQRALNSAEPGDEIVLANGAKFVGNFTLPPKAGSDWIVIRGETVSTSPGTRVNPATMKSAPAIITPNSEPALLATDGAARWRLVGFEIAQRDGSGVNYGIVVLGRGPEKTMAELPADIVLDRMYIHGTPNDNTSRCVAFNGIRMAVVQSVLQECHAKGQDAQGVGGWSGPGPFLIEDNRIEASGQGVMFGGADPSIRNVSPSDIVIRRNHFFKPLSWGRGKWTVKAAFELKHARRVLFEGNVIENHWADAQTGIAILFQAVSQYNQALEWTTIEDVMMRNNIIRNAAGGVNVLSRLNHSGKSLTLRSSRIMIRNNWFDNVGRDPFSKDGNLIVQVLADMVDFTFAENTITLLQGNAQKLVSFDGPPVQTRTSIVDNIFPAAGYSVTGRGTAAGLATLEANMPGGTFLRNVMPGQDAKPFPAGAITATAKGANLEQVKAATAGVVK